MPIVIIGGVTATGKTSTAKKLKELLHWDYVEADEYHPQSNIDKMHAGIALTDEDRHPWLLTLHKQLEKYSALNQNCVITCSALKKSYRQILLCGTADPNVQATMPCGDFYLFMLTLPRDVLHKRLVQRQSEHFMNPSLLDSQLQTLELPASKEDEPRTHVIDCDGLSPDEVIEKIRKIIKQ